MRTITIKIPDTYCNDCVFFSTGDPDPESCAGFAGFRRYWCGLFEEQLEPDYNTTPIKPDQWQSKIYKAKVCSKCRNQYK